LRGPSQSKRDRLAERFADLVAQIYISYLPIPKVPAEGERAIFQRNIGRVLREFLHSEKNQY